MKYYIYHHNDFDGCASAAVMFRYLEDKGKDAEFIPLTFNFSEEEWIDFEFKQPSVIVDFLFHPKATFWFDHHSTTFINGDFKKLYKPTKYHHLDPQYKSCVHLVYDALRSHFEFRPPPFFKGIIFWGDVIDGAEYESIKQAVWFRDPALKISGIIDIHSGDKKFLTELIKGMSRFSFDELIQMPHISAQVDILNAKINQTLEFQKNHLVNEGKVIILDESRERAPFDLRYGPFYYFPDAVYLINLKLRKGYIHLRIGANPWRRKEAKIDIANLISLYGGGGHRYVGGASFKDLESAKEALEKIKKILLAH